MDIIFPKGWRMSHMYDIYTDLVAVYDDNTEYTLKSFLELFTVDLANDSKDFWKGRKQATYEELRGRVIKDHAYVGDKHVKYMDYLLPLFYAALATKKSKNTKVNLDVTGRICNDYDIFKPPKHGWEKNYEEWYGKNWRDWRYRWHSSLGKTPHHFTLTEYEHAASDALYEEYLRAKFNIGGN